MSLASLPSPSTTDRRTDIHFRADATRKNSPGSAL
jgi:hypothetical protein